MNIKPALCGAMDFDQGVYWQSDGWIVEEKKDGIRCLVHVGPESVATGRRVSDSGRFLELTRQDVAADWHGRLTGCTFDGELMADGSYWIFDLVQFEGVDIRRERLHQRKAMLRSLSDWLPDHARVLPWFANVRELGDFDEGVVWKPLCGRYGEDWLKAKRTVTVDVKLVSYLGNGVGETENNGKVRGVPDNIPSGTLIECVAYGVHDSGKLKSGKFLRVRTDK